MGRRHKAAVAALDLDPLPASWAQRLAWHLPDAEAEPVLCAAWQTIARWLKRPEPTGNAAKRYVERVIAKLIDLGLLVRLGGVRPGRGRRAEYALRVSRNVDGFGRQFGRHEQPSTSGGVSAKDGPDVGQHTMYLDLGTNIEVPTEQLSLFGDWKRPCDDGETTPTTAASQPLSTATFSTISSPRSTRRRMRLGKHAPVGRQGEKPMSKRTKQPTLFDVPVPVVAAGQPGDAAAHVIVGEWLARCTVRPPVRIIGQVGKLIKEMIAEGVEADDIRRGCARWMVSGKHPAVLPSMVHAAQTERRPPASDDAPVLTGRDATVAEWLQFSRDAEAAQARPQWAVGA